MSQAFESVDKQHCLAVRSDKSAGKLDKVQTGKVQPKQQTWRIKNIWLPPQLALPESCLKKKTKKKHIFHLILQKIKCSVSNTLCYQVIEYTWLIT